MWSHQMLQGLPGKKRGPEVPETELAVTRTRRPLPSSGARDDPRASLAGGSEALSTHVGTPTACPSPVAEFTTTARVRPSEARAPFRAPTRAAHARRRANPAFRRALRRCRGNVVATSASWAARTMCLGKAGTVDNYSFGSRQQRKLFPLHHPPNRLGNKFLPLRGWPHTGPGHCLEDDYGLAYSLSKIPTSTKGYTLGARTAVRFKPISKDITPYPGMYQKVNTWQEKPKQSFAPFNVMMSRPRSYAKEPSYPGPGTYNPEKKPPSKVSWPMKFGSPDWCQIPCLQKRTLKAELSTDKDFKKHRNRMAYLSLYY
ncbi:ciliary microtubule-associated protein 3 [Ctenodactylus gundi]